MSAAFDFLGPGRFRSNKRNSEEEQAKHKDICMLVDSHRPRCLQGAGVIVALQSPPSNHCEFSMINCKTTCDLWASNALVIENH